MRSRFRRWRRRGGGKGRVAGALVEKVLGERGGCRPPAACGLWATWEEGRKQQREQRASECAQWWATGFIWEGNEYDGLGWAGLG
jgi:hypothetical protein